MIKNMIKLSDIITYKSRDRKNLSQNFVNSLVETPIRHFEENYIVGLNGMHIPYDNVTHINGMERKRLLHTSVIALDMDGVLFDFDKHTMNTFQLDMRGLNKSSSELTEEQRKDKSELYKRLAKVGPEWWENMPLCEGAASLYNYAKDNFSSLFILSAYVTSGKDACIEGKKLAMKKHFNHIHTSENMVVCKSSEKQAYIGHKWSEFTLLIDDRVSNINNWNERGGLSILHKDVKSTLKILEGF